MHLDDLHAEKWFYSVFFERFSSLHNDQQLMRVYRKFGADVFRRSAVLEGLDSFVKTNGFKGSRCVEIGTCNGLTSLVLARYFDEVVTIDIVPNDTKREIAEYLKVKNITFIDVKDNEEKANVINGLTFDSAFSDGNHAKDTDGDFEMVKHCGSVLFHEHWEPQPPVVELVRKLKTRGTVSTHGKWALWRRA